MRQKRWLKLVKDYDIEIKYHPRKVSKVADALSWKSTISAMSIQTLTEPFQKELINAEIEFITGSLALTFQPTILDGMKEHQEADRLLVRTRKDVLEELDISIFDDGWHTLSRLCFANEKKLKE